MGHELVPPYAYTVFFLLLCSSPCGSLSCIKCRSTEDWTCKTYPPPATPCEDAIEREARFYRKRNPKNPKVTLACYTRQVKRMDGTVEMYRGCELVGIRCRADCHFFCNYNECNKSSRLRCNFYLVILSAIVPFIVTGAALLN